MLALGFVRSGATGIKCAGSLFRISPGILSSALNVTPVAHLTALSLVETRTRVKPWPYKEKTYNQFWQFFDHTSKRFDDNTRLIVVDGNIATGKTEFAKKVAESFNLLYMPDVHPDEVWLNEDGYDMRKLDEQFSDGPNKSYDLEKFLSDKNPKNLKVGRPQMLLYYKRFYHYVSALEHILNTGQGVVMERSVFSDMVFPEVFAQLGYMTPEALTFYKNMLRKNTICDLWKPHLIIYLDAPIATVRENINKRGIPYEVNSPVLTDDFLRKVDAAYKKKLFPSLRDHTEIISYDISNLPDWEIIIEELEELNLVEVESQPEKFKEWRQRREDDFNNYRMVVSMKDTLHPLFLVEPPLDAPELMIHGEDLIELETVIHNNPGIYYKKGYNPETDNVLFKL
ncbi:NDUFA10 [Acanthosepion pharaonis]|uniref:NADH dehydrogenase [ubiquinone] 1 alpha subcomplex subunit 10, mitochondrial n=1 Tax=Acanthosepion pharaonis TaxID=158019 RepID=A0A812D530_ACAPH|nr:NDUFA10 [Sepia pharaonis]